MLLFHYLFIVIVIIIIPPRSRKFLSNLFSRKQARSSFGYRPYLPPCREVESHPIRSKHEVLASLCNGVGAQAFLSPAPLTSRKHLIFFPFAEILFSSQGQKTGWDSGRERNLCLTPCCWSYADFSIRTEGGEHTEEALPFHTFSMCCFCIFHCCLSVIPSWAKELSGEHISSEHTL